LNQYQRKKSCYLHRAGCGKLRGPYQAPPDPGSNGKGDGLVQEGDDLEHDAPISLSETSSSSNTAEAASAEAAAPPSFLQIRKGDNETESNESLNSYLS
jgi:hypothetical protein